MKSIYVSDDGNVTTEPVADEPPDVIYDDDGKMYREVRKWRP